MVVDIPQAAQISRRISDGTRFPVGSRTFAARQQGRNVPPSRGLPASGAICAR